MALPRGGDVGLSLTTSATSRASHRMARMHLHYYADTCLPGKHTLQSGTNGTLRMCCCTLEQCKAFGGTLEDEVGTVFAQSVYFLLLIIICFLIFKAVQTGIRYNWQNIPFYIAALMYEAPERVRWVDPWREDKGLGTPREEPDSSRQERRLKSM